MEGPTSGKCVLTDGLDRCGWVPARSGSWHGVRLFLRSSRVAPSRLQRPGRRGFSRKQLRGASWRRVRGGLYAWTGLADDPTLILRALQRRLPGGAVFSGQTAGWLHGLDMPPADPVEATVPYRCGVSARAGMCIRHGTLSTDDILERQGVLVTSPLRTAFDLARHRAWSKLSWQWTRRCIVG